MRASSRGDSCNVERELLVSIGGSIGSSEDAEDRRSICGEEEKVEGGAWPSKDVTTAVDIAMLVLVIVVVRTSVALVG